MPRETFRTDYDDRTPYAVQGSLLNQVGRSLNDGASFGRSSGSGTRRGAVSLSSGPDMPRWLSEIQVVNWTSSDLRRGDIVQLGEFGVGDDALVETDLEKFWPRLKGIKPTGRVHQIAVLLEPATKGGGSARCQIDGVCPARVNITELAHRRVVGVADSHVLQSGMCGHGEIMWRPNATGEQWCLVKLGTIQSVELLAKSTEVIPAATYSTSERVAPGTGTADVWTWDYDADESVPLNSDPNDDQSPAVQLEVNNYGPTNYEVAAGMLMLIQSCDDFRWKITVVFCEDGFPA